MAGFIYCNIFMNYRQRQILREQLRPQLQRFSLKSGFSSKFRTYLVKGRIKVNGRNERVCRLSEITGDIEVHPHVECGILWMHLTEARMRVEKENFDTAVGMAKSVARQGVCLGDISKKNEREIARMMAKYWKSGYEFNRWYTQTSCLQMV
jgi:hypothetical protein